MVLNGLDNLQSFVVENVVLSFVILCGVNISVILAINSYVFDFDAFLKSSFDDCLQRCAQYNQRQAYEGKLASFARFCSAVIQNKEGRCWLKASVTTFLDLAIGSSDAILTILQYLAIIAIEANVNSNILIRQISSVDENSLDSHFQIALK